ncbi:DUF2231 domain-containing protein [Autumnicola psychrophila]|uniref:DUF2231 domain-containing protein n=1 Tax=Autumnicola psychrophila TaxID=3075592 RepID=A0ABU3DV70_9FLAO|nr:DUF2231 domain-containing protein [Zunongwangia sp. F225]MDT0687620.1 DUF2231 domain-containing protein [Zunongwangia sp. F225]
MAEIPEFWRTEVYHPLSVHFPIVLLLLAFIFKLFALKFKRELWETGGTLMLLLGVVGIWIAIYTGNLADGIVSRKLCDPTILKDHENMAYLSAYIFSGSLLVDLAAYFKISFFRKLIVQFVLVLGLAAGTGVLMYVGHLGVTLVYQQAAGVNIPSGNCAEFE